MELEFERVWLPYLYLYGVGGLIFFTGLIMVLKSPAYSHKRLKDRKWLGTLLFGYFWYAGMHGVGILAAIS
ncbi:MAG: hypothetical protein HQ519_05800 [Planctomycetes bacterium]|nr:hypothetical protein [Planctomycetota bacterium]NQU48142.1 hypothetical protein [Planctomycetota bacterium]